jgi:hypothetical protein
MASSENKYAATAWGVEQFVDLMVPSGQMCQVRRPGTEGLMRMGLLDKTKGLMALVDTKHIKRVKGSVDQKAVSEKVAQEISNNPEKINELMSTIDKIVKYVVIQPELALPFKISPSGEEIALLDSEREQGVIYTDFISLEDRMFLFQYAVGGSSDLERFRGEFGESLASLSDGSKLSL